MSRLSALIVVLAATLLGGCQGQYTFTIPEQVAPSGGAAIVVVRLQKSEFAAISPPVKNICVRFRVEEGPLAAAYTDDRGYAAANVSVPAAPGRYHVVAEIMDKDGREASAFSPVYVLDKHPATVAIDLNCLTGLKKDERTQAKAALIAISQRANIVYFTDSTANQTLRHGMMKAEGFPDGAILQWQRQFWHTKKEGAISRVIMEDRMVSQLPILRQMLPNLKIGITNSKLAAEAFAKADIKCITVGQTGIFKTFPFQKMPANTQRLSWQQLAQQWESGGKKSVALATQPAAQSMIPETQSTIQLVIPDTQPSTQVVTPEAQPTTQPATCETQTQTQPATSEPQPITPETQPVTAPVTQPATFEVQPVIQPTTSETQPATPPSTQSAMPDTQPEIGGQ